MRVVTSGHVTNIAVTPFDPPTSISTNSISIKYRANFTALYFIETVIADINFTLWEQGFWTIFTLADENIWILVVIMITLIVVFVLLINYRLASSLWRKLIQCSWATFGLCHRSLINTDSHANYLSNNNKQYTKLTDMSIHFFKIFCVYLLADNLGSNKVFLCQAKPHLF